jgi:predicted nucleic acid-binding protein
VIVLGEFRYGIADSRHRAEYEEWLESHLPQFEILPVTDRTAVATQTFALRSGSRGGRFRRMTPGSLRLHSNTGCLS